MHISNKILPALELFWYKPYFQVAIQQGLVLVNEEWNKIKNFIYI